MPSASLRHRAVNLVEEVEPLAAAGEPDRGRPPLRRRPRDDGGGIGVAAGPGIARLRRGSSCGALAARATSAREQAQRNARFEASNRSIAAS